MKKFIEAILAGIFICIGCAVNLKVGGVAGACLFSFGLAGIIAMKLNLFTGIAGDSLPAKDLFISLAGNMGGCILAGLVLGTNPDLQEAANTIIVGRGSLVSAFLYSIFCGIIVTTAVRGARENKWIPLLLGVPIFILCGFPHCIADFGYICIGRNFYLTWPLTVLGNYLGCNYLKLLEIK